MYIIIYAINLQMSGVLIYSANSVLENVFIVVYNNHFTNCTGSGLRRFIKASSHSAVWSFASRPCPYDYKKETTYLIIRSDS